MLTAICLLFLAACAIAGTVIGSKRRYVNDRQPTRWEREAAWERRRGEHRARERLRMARVAAAFDARASVQPKFTPRLPS